MRRDSRGRSGWRRPRLRALVGALSAAVVASTLNVGLIDDLRTTDAAWQTSEWAHTGVGASDCTASGVARTRGNGRLLSGGLLGLDLDTVATVRGMTVTHNAVTATPAPSGATAGGSNSWRNPLDVGVLSAINLPLSSTSLDDLLEIPLATDVGVLNQWAQANSTGQSAGAAGVVNNSGVVMTNADFGGSAPPDLGTLKLSRLVSQVTGQAVAGLVANVTDVDLEIGAVAGRALLNSCQQAWGQAGALTRQYAIAGLDLAVASPLVGQLVTAVNSTVSATQTLVNSLASNTGLLSTITSGVGGLLTGTLGGVLGVGTVSITGPTATVDFSAVNQLLTTPIADDAGLVSIDLAGGMVRVDLAKLLGQVYSGTGFAGTGPGLNGLAPNTELVLNAAVVNSLTGVLTTALDDWVADVLAALQSAVLAARVSFTVNVPITLLSTGIPLVTLRVSATNVALSSLIAGTATLTLVVDPLVTGSCVNLALTPLACLIGGITSALLTGVGPLVGNAIRTVLLGPSSPIAGLGATLHSITAPLVTAVGAVLTTYLGVNGLASLRANVQNDPVPVSSATYPEWESPPQEVPTGRFDVAALGVVVLGATGTSPSINLELARGSVGLNCGLGSVSDHAGKCAGY